jgi:prophage regulatory protein
MAANRNRRDAVLSALQMPRTAADVAATLRITREAAAQLCRTYTKSGDLAVVGVAANGVGRPLNLYVIESLRDRYMKATNQPPPADAPRELPAIAPGSGIIILRLPDVETKTGLKRPAIYRLMRLGQFPVAVRLPNRAVGWIASEVNDWLMLRATNDRLRI